MAEHAVIVVYELADDEFGSTEERGRIRLLERDLTNAINDAGVGEFDGDEFGGGRVSLYAYGPDADALFAAMESVVRMSPIKPASVMIRYGDVGDENVREVRLALLTSNLMVSRSLSWCG